MAEALYRKYRPQIFEDVVGQEHIERTIKNAIEQDKVSHAYLFTGPRGTGKTTTARLLAKALLCEKGPTSEPDGTCDDCLAVANGDHPDVYELDAASRTGVENVREEIIGRVQFAPTRGRYKIYIIDEVHMLSTAAFNALLKTLEEPPSHVVFILATTDPQKVPETIHSRCQRFDFRRISSDSIVSRLGAICVAEDVEFEGEALELVAHRAEGGMRNALTSLEQLIAFGGGKVTMEVAERMLGSLDSSDLAEIVRFVGVRDVAACFRWTAEFVETGADLAQFTRDFAEHMRNMYVMSLAGEDVTLDVSEAGRRELAEELKMYGPDRLARMLGVLGDLSAELKTSTNPRLSFEIALTRMVRPESDLTLASLAERLERLEQGGFAQAAAQTAQAAAAQAAAQTQAAQAAQAAAAQAAAAQMTQPAQAAAQTAQVARAAQPAQIAQQVQPQVAQQAQTAQQVQPQVAQSAQRVAQAAGSATALAVDLTNPAALQRTWQQVLGRVKKAKAAYGVLFLNSKVSFDAATATFFIEFSAENDFAFRAAQKPDILQELTAAFNASCGGPVAFQIVKAGAADSSAANAQVAQAQAQAAQAAQIAQAQAQPVQHDAAQIQAAQTQAAAQAKAQAAIQAEAQRRAAEEAQRRAAEEAQAARAAQAAAQQQAQVAAQQQARPAAAYDEVPVDIYDDYVPYDDESWPSQGDGWSSASAAQPSASTAPAEPTPSAAAPSAAAPSAAVASDEPSKYDLDAMLAFGFGEGVVFKEV